MTQLTAEQIAQHAHDAGFRGDDLTTAVAVAMAESGGDPGSHNGTPPDNSYGLWQINMIDDLGPHRREEFDLDSNEDLLEPGANAEAAYDIYSDKGKSFEDWSTYENGDYEKHLDEARKAADQVSGGSDEGSGPDGSDGGQGPDGAGGKNSGGGDGIDVNTDYLLAYAKKVEEISEELKNVGRTTANTISGIAEDSFGEIGRETGFTDALVSFTKSLEKQVEATGSTAGELGEAMENVMKTYQEVDEKAAGELKRAFEA